MSAKKYLFIALVVMITPMFTWGDWEDRKGPPPVVYLSQLLENPESWLDVPVRIPLRFSGVRQIYTPFFTRFDRDSYLNFSAWDVHTHIWQKEGFMDDYPFFYVDKGEKEFKAFLKLKKFETIAVMGTVSSIFQGKPYFKIVWVCKQDGDLNVHNLTLLNRGTTAFEEGQFDAAIDYFSQVFKTNPPDDIRAMMHKTLAQVYLYEKKNYQSALRQLRRGLSITQNDPQLKEMYAQCEYYLKHGGAEPRPIIVRVDEEEVAEQNTSPLNNVSTSGQIEANNYTEIKTENLETTTKPTEEDIKTDDFSEYENDDAETGESNTETGESNTETGESDIYDAEDETNDEDVFEDSESEDRF